MANSSALALKVIENEINFLNKLIENKDVKIKELEHQLEVERNKNKTNRPYLGYMTLDGISNKGIIETGVKLLND
ncbi:TPA: hypothetical protein KOX39_003449 [Clostridioides difficile]|nr:hypothetical protein [Clostridioides difficile]